MARLAGQRLVDQYINQTLREIQERIERAEPLVGAAELARDLILARTARGVDRHGRHFARYRPSTARRKGRFAPVTLSESGSMLSSLTVEASGYWGRYRRAQIKVARGRDERIARLHIDGTRKMAQRDFMGVTPREENLLHQRLVQTIERAVPKDRRRRITISLFSA